LTIDLETVKIDLRGLKTVFVVSRYSFQISWKLTWTPKSNSEPIKSDIKSLKFAFELRKRENHEKIW